MNGSILSIRSRCAFTAFTVGLAHIRFRVWRTYLPHTTAYFVTGLRGRSPPAVYCSHLLRYPVGLNTRLTQLCVAWLHRYSYLPFTDVTLTPYLIAPFPSPTRLPVATPHSVDHHTHFGSPYDTLPVCTTHPYLPTLQPLPLPYPHPTYTPGHTRRYICRPQLDITFISPHLVPCTPSPPIAQHAPTPWVGGCGCPTVPPSHTHHRAYSSCAGPWTLPYPPITLP